jgi:cobalt/nickel transport system permease protein
MVLQVSIETSAPQRPEGGALVPVGIPGRRARRGWFEKTLESVTGTLESTVFAEEMASLPGLWQGVDARAKLIAAVALILAASLARSIPVLIILYVLALVVAVAGRIPLGFFIKRVWLFLPLFTAIIALPAVFSVVTPGRAVAVLLGDPYVAVTEQGLRTAGLLILRVGVSVSFSVVLILTTRWAALLGGLRAMRVPQVFVLILGMTYRYIFVLLHITNDMFLARKSRMVGRAPANTERAWIAGAMGALLGKSYHLSDQVYLAMVSRGFRGEVRMLEPLHMQPSDWGWIIISILVPTLVLVLGGLLES